MNKFQFWIETKFVCKFLALRVRESVEMNNLSAAVERKHKSEIGMPSLCLYQS